MTDSKKQKLAALKQALAEGKIDTAARLLGTERTAAAPEKTAPPPDIRRDILAKAFRASPVTFGPAACLHLQPDLERLRPDWAEIAAQFHTIARGARQRFDELPASAGLCLAADCPADNILLMTLSSAAKPDPIVFQAALLQSRSGQFTMDHYLAAGGDDEPAVLHAVAQRLAEVPLVVTFDTKPDALAVFATRAVACDVPLPDRPPRNLNLRADLRKRFTGQLQSFSLNALEQVLTGYRRTDRLDRRAVPDIYTHFLRTAETAPLIRAVACAQLDLVAMVKLLCVLMTDAEPYLD